MIDLSKGTYFEAINMKGLLESNDIKVVGFNPVILRVYNEDLEKVKEIVEDYQTRI
jgi:hypothetical protein